MIARFRVVALDCPDPAALARFYRALTGWPVADDSSGDWFELDSPDGATLAFQKVVEHQPPDWPTGPRPQQAHLDFEVADLDIGEAEVVAIGARKVDIQPSPDRWRVFLDPAGHPFCLVRAGTA